MSDPITVSEIVRTVMEQGVLGVLLAWFMVRIEKALTNNTAALQEVKVVMQRCKHDGV